MFARRRPLARAAVVGGAAYYGGKKHAEHQAAQQQEAYDAGLADAARAEEPAQDPMEQLRQLGELHDQGILTDAEFDAQKQKILQQM
jgi:hypothetical protein